MPPATRMIFLPMAELTALVDDDDEASRPRKPRLCIKDEGSARHASATLLAGSLMSRYAIQNSTWGVTWL